MKLLFAVLLLIPVFFLLFLFLMRPSRRRRDLPPHRYERPVEYGADDDYSVGWQPSRDPVAAPEPAGVSSDPIPYSPAADLPAPDSGGWVTDGGNSNW